MQLALLQIDFSDTDYMYSIAGSTNTYDFKFNQIVYMFVYTDLLICASYVSFCSLLHLLGETRSTKVSSP